MKMYAYFNRCIVIDASLDSCINSLHARVTSRGESKTTFNTCKFAMFALTWRRMSTMCDWLIERLTLTGKGLRDLVMGGKGWVMGWGGGKL